MDWGADFFLTRHDAAILVTKIDVNQIWRRPQVGHFNRHKFTTYLLHLGCHDSRGLPVVSRVSYTGMWMSVSQQFQWSLYVFTPGFTVVSQFCLFFGALNLDTWGIDWLSFEALGRCKACSTAAHFTRWVASYFPCPIVCKKTLADRKAGRTVLFLSDFFGCDQK